MATGDLGNRNNNPLDMLTQLLTTFKGSAATTTTTRETVSDEKTKALLDQILGGTSGLAAVSGMQKGAGLYNSTTNKLLTNDLLSKAAAQSAALSSTKSTTQQTGPQANPLMALGSLVGGQVVSKLGAPILAGAKKKLGLGNGTEDPLTSIGNSISDALFGGGGSSVVNTPYQAAMNVYPAAFDSTPVNSARLQDVSDLGNIGGNAAGLAGASALASLASGGGAAAGATGGGYAIAAGDTAFMSSAAAAGASEAAGVAGAAEVAGAAGGTAGIGSALATAGPYALAAYAISEGSKALGIKEVPHWIICTELNKQGRMPHKYYRYGGREFLKYDAQGKQGYYIWAIPSVRHLKKYPNSTYSKLMCWVFNHRAEYLSAIGGCAGARKTVAGFITTHGLYALCWTLSRTIARKPVTEYQILGA